MFSLFLGSILKLSLFLFVVRIFSEVWNDASYCNCNVIQWGLNQNIRKGFIFWDGVCSISKFSLILFSALFLWYSKYCFLIPLQSEKNLCFPWEGRGGRGISKLPLFLFILWFLWNLVCCSIISFQGDSIRLKLQYQKGAVFFLWWSGVGKFQN